MYLKAPVEQGAGGTVYYSKASITFMYVPDLTIVTYFKDFWFLMISLLPGQVHMFLFQDWFDNVL